MGSPALTKLAAFALAGLVCATTASAQTTTGSTTPPPPPPTAQAPAVPPNVDRIRVQVNKPSTLVVDSDGQLRIYVEIIGNWPTFYEYTKGTDFLKGAAPSRGAITHAEMFNPLQPKELYGSGGISATELLQGAIVNWLGHKIISKGLKEISEARNARQIAEIRERIDRELAALKGGK